MLTDEISRTRKMLDTLQADGGRERQNLPANPNTDTSGVNAQQLASRAASSPEPAPPPGDNATMTKQAKDAIARGANPALVKKRYKEMTGKELIP